MPTSTTKFLEEQIVLKIARTAAGAITANRLVKMDATDHSKCTQSLNAIDTDIIGVALCDAVAGEEVQIAVEGIVPVQVQAAQTVSKGDLLITSSTGRVQLYTGSATVLNNIIGQAITAGGSLELVSVLLARSAHFGANAS